MAEAPPSIQPAGVMESQVAVAGAAETEAEAGKRSTIGSASQGSLVSAPKGAVRWKLLRQVRASARCSASGHSPRSAPQPGADFPVCQESSEKRPLASSALFHQKRETLAGLDSESGTARARSQKLSSK